MMGESEREDWNGLWFLYTSLAVTALSIIFFFAGRQIFNKMEFIGGSQWHQLWSELASRGGFMIQEVTWVDREKKLKKLPEQYFQEDELRSILEEQEGRFRWNFQVGDLQESLSQMSWTGEVKVRRRFMDRVEVSIEPRVPVVAVRSRNGWVFVDQEGQFLSHHESFLGEWSHLTIVYGLESVTSNHVERMNRYLKQESQWLADLSTLIRDLRTSIGIEVASAKISFEPWARGALYTLRWRAQWASDQDPWHQLQVRSNTWRGRLESLQYILSDMRDDMDQSLHIAGQFDSRWYVKPAIRERLSDG